MRLIAIANYGFICGGEGQLEAGVKIFDQQACINANVVIFKPEQQFAFNTQTQTCLDAQTNKFNTESAAHVSWSWT